MHQLSLKVNFEDCDMSGVAVASHYADYLGPAFLEDDLSIETKILAFNGRFTRIDQNISKENKLIYKSEMILAFIDLKTKKLTHASNNVIHHLSLDQLDNNVSIL